MFLVGRFLKIFSEATWPIGFIIFVFNISVSDCCLVPSGQFFSAISWRDEFIFLGDDGDVRFVLDQYAKLDIYSATCSSLKQQSADRHFASL